YRILGANVRYTDGRDVEWIQDDTLVQRGTVRIGIIGITTRSTPTTTRTINVQGLRFDDPVPIIDARANALRARGADYVIVIGHVGASCDATGETACRGEIMDIASRIRE